LLGIFLILLVLVQRGRGGGIAGALGGMGGNSAFGTKAGDTFTWITYATAAIWIMLAMLTIKTFTDPQKDKDTAQANNREELPPETKDPRKEIKIDEPPKNVDDNGVEDKDEFKPAVGGTTSDKEKEPVVDGTKPDSEPDGSTTPEPKADDKPATPPSDKPEDQPAPEKDPDEKATDPEPTEDGK
jgi:preprotein translocase subunit SecG